MVTGLREPDWIRTNDLLLRRQLLYPTELPVRFRAKIMYLSLKPKAQSLKPTAFAKALAVKESVMHL